MTQEEELKRLMNKQVRLSEHQAQLQSTQTELEKKYIVSPSPKFTLSKPWQILKKTSKKVLKVVYWTVTLQLKKKIERKKLAQIVTGSGLFDRNYYLQQQPEIGELGIDPLEHYLDIGRHKGYRISCLFDSDYYLRRYPEVVHSQLDPLIHYLTLGQKSGYDIHPLFDTAYYLRHYPEVRQSPLAPVVHYLTIGAQQGYNPHPLFDTAYYLDCSPDLQGKNINPLVHYLIWGAAEGRNPHPLFDIAYYLQQNPSSATSRSNPLISYLEKESFGRDNPHPLFDRAYYERQEPSLTEKGVNPLLHYLEEGFLLGYDPHPLFKTSFYLEQVPQMAEAKINPLVDYLKEGAFLGRDPHPLFDSSYYLAKNPGVAAAKINPLLDYLKRGAFEGRLAWSADRLATLAGYTQEEQPVQSLLPEAVDASLSIASDLVRNLKIGVYCSSLGNYFMAEIAQVIATAFAHIGVETICLSERDRRPSDITHDVIVAPHEFFYLGRGESWAKDKGWLARAVMVNVEQPHTSWFSKSFHFLRQSALVFDINLQAATVLRALGITAHFLPLGYLPDYPPFSWQRERPDLLALRSISLQSWQSIENLDSPWAARPLDLLFIGYLSPRRQAFFAENARWLQQYRCFFHIPPLSGPLIQGKGNALTTAGVIGLSQRSKILLNIHQGDLNYFEWHRIVFHGLWQKTLVITEPCHPIPGLIANQHYIEIPLEQMESRIDELLNTPTGRVEAERIRQAGHLIFKERFPLETIITKALALMVEPASE